MPIVVMATINRRLISDVGGDATPTRDRLECLNPTYIRAPARYIICATQAPARMRVLYILYYFN